MTADICRECGRPTIIVLHPGGYCPRCWALPAPSTVTLKRKGAR